MQSIKKHTFKILKIIIIFAFWMGVWQLLASATDNELLFPTPISVLRRFLELASGAEFYKIILYSMIRVLLGTISAVLCGILLGALTSQCKIVYDFLRPLMTVIKSTPVSSFIILALVWMRRTLLPIFIVYLIVLPVVFSNVHEGIKSADPKLVEMTKVYRIPFLKKIRVLYIPSVLPYFRSAIMTSTGLAWKAGIAAEVLAAPAISIGKMLFESKQYLETTDLFAWTLAVIVMSLIIELILGAISGKFLSADKRTRNGGKADA